VFVLFQLYFNFAITLARLIASIKPHL